MAFPSGPGVDPPLVMVPGMSGAVVDEFEADRRKGGGQFLVDGARHRPLRHCSFLEDIQFGLTLRPMPAAFQYKPRFTDIRVKPPRPEEDVAEADVTRLKPGEVRCEWPDCVRAASARAPKSRERLNEFYQFCQPHAAEYNKAWNFYAGMSEGEVRAAQQNEAMTGGRPTWEMKAGKMSREAAAFAAKMGTGNTGGAGSWRDSFGLFGRRSGYTPPKEEPGTHLGRLERQALADLDLDAGADRAAVKRRYHELLKRFHPDTNGGDRTAEAKLQRVIKAWKTLKKAGLA